MYLPVAGRNVVCVRSASTLHTPRFFVHSPLHEGWEDSLHLVPSLYPSCPEITTHHRIGRAPGREEKDTPYSLDINLITMRLSIWGGCD